MPCWNGKEVVNRLNSGSAVKSILMGKWNRSHVIALLKSPSSSSFLLKKEGLWQVPWNGLCVMIHDSRWITQLIRSNWTCPFPKVRSSSTKYDILILNMFEDFLFTFNSFIFFLFVWIRKPFTILIWFTLCGREEEAWSTPDYFFNFFFLFRAVWACGCWPIWLIGHFNLFALFSHSFRWFRVHRSPSICCCSLLNLILLDLLPLSFLSSFRSLFLSFWNKKQ